MEQIVSTVVAFAGTTVYFAAIIAAVTLPIWGYKVIEKKFMGKHSALRVSGSSAKTSTMGIIASIGTTTSGVFLIQVLPLIFSMINDVGGVFAVDAVYGDHLTGTGMGEYVDSFFGLTAELGDIMQTAAPMAAVGLGGYNLLNNISRGLPAVFGGGKHQ